MLYRSVLHIKKKSFCSCDFFVDRYQWHRSLCKVFAPTGVPDAYKWLALQDARPLFHFEADQERMLLVVQSRTFPDWSHLEDCRAAPLLEPEVLCWPQGKLSGRRMTFKLSARPSRSVYGKREILRLPGDQLNWLSRKAAASGFQVVYAGVEPMAFVLGERSNYRRRLWGSTLRGELIVTDRERFVRAVERGFGPNKAYGFGLLLTA